MRVLHQTVVLENGYPVCFISHLLSHVRCISLTGRDKLLYGNGVGVKVLEGQVREEGDIADFGESEFDIGLTGLGLCCVHFGRY